MPASDWEQIQSFIFDFCSTLSYFTNGLLLFLVFLKSPKQLLRYKHLMIYVSCFQMIFAMVGMISGPKLLSWGTSFVVFRETSFHSIVDVLLVVFYCGFFGASLAVFAVQFFFRYAAVDKTFRFRYFEGVKFYLWLIFPFIYGAVWGGTCLFCFAPSRTTSAYITEPLAVNHGYQIDEISYIGTSILIYYPDGTTEIDLKSMTGMLILVIQLVSSLAAVFYYGVNCFLLTRAMIGTATVVSSTTKSLQNQLFYALVVQTAIPLFLMYLPAAALFVFPFLGYYSSFSVKYISTAIAMTPLIDPIPTIFIISNYRRAVTKHFPAKFPMRKHDRHVRNMQYVTTTMESSNIL